ncbi:MAG TPA: hypothetical protein K8V24_07975 [Limosilactobacillus reuteri]|nr:hypothetical protein [Limosilactobacillus reuteri]
MQSNDLLDQLFDGWTLQQAQTASMKQLPEYKNCVREVDFGADVGREFDWDN